MTERKAIRESVEELEKFERNNPKIFQADGSVRFSALVTWEISGDKPVTDNDVYVGWYPDGSGRIHLERPDGIDGYEVYWRFYADISHYYMYDSSTNTLRIMDNRHYMEISIEPDLSIVELIELQKNVN